MIDYSKYRYIFPPRPKNVIAPDFLKKYDNGEYIAEPRLNGDCLVLFTNGIDFHVLNGHKKEFKKHKKIENQMCDLYRETVIPGKPINKWMVLVGEYMSKSKKNEWVENFNDNFVIFDILVYDSIQLIGKTFSQRIDLLNRLYGTDDCLLIKDGIRRHKFLYTTSDNTPNCFRIKTFRDCFPALWKDVTKIDMYEGLVLKRAEAALENGVSENNNTNGQIKIIK